ncbi:MAG TPA: TrmH family RNA methyltransferase [Candidatus Saccharimonadales bacterium]
MDKTSNKLSSIVVIAHNLRSAHNVGSLFRTCEGLAVDRLILSGYTPYPRLAKDSRLPHIVEKLDKQIAKTALKTEDNIKWSHVDELETIVDELKAEGYNIVGLEQSTLSIKVMDYKLQDKQAIIIGNEPLGLDDQAIALCDQLVEIPMLGKKESFNVVQATAMLLFYLRFV